MCELIKKSVDSPKQKINASSQSIFLFKNYYQMDTRLSLATNIGSCSVILNASYQFPI